MTPMAGAMGLALVAALFDVRTARIPNVLTLGGAAAGLVWHMAADGRVGASASGWLVGLLIFLPIYLLGAMGAGDVKLMAALGAWIGVGPVLQTAAFGAVAGGLLALLTALRHGVLRATLANITGLLRYWRLVGVQPLPALTLADGRGPRLPYALPVLLGLLTTAWRA